MTHSRAGLVCAVALFCVIGCTLPAAASATGLIVRRDAGLSAAERADVRADAGVELERIMRVPNSEVVTVPAARASEALDALNADPDVRYALPDTRLHVAAGDLMGSQWALYNDGSLFANLVPRAVDDADIDAPEAWQTMEGRNVTVAVVDQLVYADHPDLLDRVDPGLDVTKADACTAGTPTGPNDHGTAVAGVISADGRGSGGVAGVAPLSHVLPVRAIDNCGGGDLAWVLDGFEAAAERAPIVSASFGSDPNAINPAMNQAFLDIFDAHPNTLFVVAAGNEGANVDDPAHPVYPCSTRRAGPPAQQEVRNLLCVGMTDYADRPACWGNVGPASVDLFAPGISIWSTIRGGSGHYPFNGTSMAAPMVAATAALVLSNEPTLGAVGVAERLVADGVDLKYALGAISVSGGRLNAARALLPSGRSYGSGGGDPGPWATCDRDHDGLRDDASQPDHCPDQPGPAALNGCPDTDGDGITDGDDNCSSVANVDQSDTDLDRVGNACDQMPRGDDPDGDGVPAMDDHCPDQAGTSPDGCPVVVNPPGGNPEPPRPTPTVTPQTAPQIVSLAYRLSKCPKGRKQCAKVATVTVKVSRQAKVALKVERQDRKRGRLVWKRVKSQSLTATARGRSLKVRGRRSRPNARYRVTATLAGKAKAVSFKV